MSSWSSDFALIGRVLCVRRIPLMRSLLFKGWGLRLMVCMISRVNMLVYWAIFSPRELWQLATLCTSAETWLIHRQLYIWAIWSCSTLRLGQLLSIHTAGFPTWVKDLAFGDWPLLFFRGSATSGESVHLLLFSLSYRFRWITHMSTFLQVSMWWTWDINHL